MNYLVYIVGDCNTTITCRPQLNSLHIIQPLRSMIIVFFSIQIQKYNLFYV